MISLAKLVLAVSRSLSRNSKIEKHCVLACLIGQLTWQTVLVNFFSLSRKMYQRKFWDLLLFGTSGVFAMSQFSVYYFKMFSRKFWTFLHFKIILIWWLSIRNRTWKFTFEIGKIHSKIDRHTLKEVVQILAEFVFFFFQLC